MGFNHGGKMDRDLKSAITTFFYNNHIDFA